MGRAFTGREAAAHGVTRRMLQGARFEQVHLGVWRAAATPLTFDVRVQAALLALPHDAALSHVTALRWIGFETGPELPLHLSTATAAHVERQGLVVHRRQALLRPVLVRGVPVLDAARTFVDAATQLDGRALLRVGDWLIRHGHVDLLDLRAFVLQSHLDGVQHARTIAPLVRERVDSVRESDVRWIVIDAGLPVPEPNVPIVDRHGVRLAKGDLVYERWKVIVEHDGWHHERDAQQRQRDHLRREMLEALGWVVVVITVKDFENERAIAWRVYNALARRGYAGPRPSFGA
jgi:hypothetical protein